VLTFSVVDAGSAEAQAAMGEYLAELARRFPDGFSAPGALEEAAVRYNPPNGVFLVGRVDGAVVACGGLDFLDDETAEVKRMWVSPAQRGSGVGRALLARLEAEAAAAGRTAVVLDTNGTLAEALALYRSAGYVEIERYNDNPYAEHWFRTSLDR
jgi:GNAT superfamily N-acetyltransferase